jgi:hypothetical protein
MKRDDSDFHSQWEDDFDRKKKKKSINKVSGYKRKEKYKNNYFEDDY